MAQARSTSRLATYPMMVDPRVRHLCFTSLHVQRAALGAGHYYITAAQDWEFPPRPRRMHHACKVSTHAPATMKTATAPRGRTPPLRRLYSRTRRRSSRFPSASPRSRSSTTSTRRRKPAPNPQQPRVRAAYSWFTPLGKSLFLRPRLLRQRKSRFRWATTARSCAEAGHRLLHRRAETCNVSATDPYFPLTWAGNLATNTKLKVVTHTVGIDIDASTQPCSCPSPARAKALLQRVREHRLAEGRVPRHRGQVQPPVETCDGKDNDCDNLVDEDFSSKGQSCNNGKVGVCYKTGTYVCKGDAAVWCATPPTRRARPRSATASTTTATARSTRGWRACNPSCQPEICNGKDD